MQLLVLCISGQESSQGRKSDFNNTTVFEVPWLPVLFWWYVAWGMQKSNSFSPALLDTKNSDYLSGSCESSPSSVDKLIFTSEGGNMPHVHQQLMTWSFKLQYHIPLPCPASTLPFLSRSQGGGSIIHRNDDFSTLRMLWFCSFLTQSCYLKAADMAGLCLKSTCRASKRPSRTLSSQDLPLMVSIGNRSSLWPVSERREKESRWCWKRMLAGAVKKDSLYS